MEIYVDLSIQEEIELDQKLLKKEDEISPNPQIQYRESQEGREIGRMGK